MTPVIQDNPSGWGPCAVPEQFRDMPYQPFSKGDRLGKVLTCQRGVNLLSCSWCSKFISILFSQKDNGYKLSLLPVVIGELGSYKAILSQSF